MADVTFIFHSDWLNNIDKLPIDSQDKIIADMVRYGAGLKTQYDDDSWVSSMVNFVKGSIDYSKNKYAEKSENGKKNAGKKKVSDKAVWELAQEGKNSTEIAEILHCGKSTVDHSDGWKNRNAQMPPFEF